MTAHTLSITDTIALPQSAFDANGKLPRTSDGYALMDCPVARSGIQEYLAAEMGDAFKDRDPRSIIKVYRPDDVIFGDASLASYAHKPLTNDHPPEAVTAENWKKYAIGHTGDEVRQDGKRVRVPMLMADAAAIADVESGKREWSAGYGVTFDILPDGVAPDGTIADAIVTGQKINHIALVDRGRAGPECRIGDNERRTTVEPIDGGRQMAEVKMTFDGVPFNVADATAEAVVNKIIAARDAETTRATAAEGKVAELTTSVATKDAEIVALKQAVEDAKITPEKLRDAAKVYAKVVEDAKKIAPTLAVADNADAAAIKAAVVSHKLGDAAKGWTDAQNEVGFATLAASVTDSTVDGVARVISDGALTQATDAESAAHAAYVERLTKKKAA